MIYKWLLSSLWSRRDYCIAYTVDLDSEPRAPFHSYHVSKLPYSVHKMRNLCLKERNSKKTWTPFMKKIWVWQVWSVPTVFDHTVNDVPTEIYRVFTTLQSASQVILVYVTLAVFHTYQESGLRIFKILVKLILFSLRPLLVKIIWNYNLVYFYISF